MSHKDGEVSYDIDQEFLASLEQLAGMYILRQEFFSVAQSLFNFFKAVAKAASSPVSGISRKISCTRGPAI